MVAEEITPKKSEISSDFSLKHNIPVIISGKSIQKYRFIKNNFKWGTKSVISSLHTKKNFQTTEIIGTRLCNIYRTVLKPSRFLAGDNVIRIFNKSELSDSCLILILNSHLMSYVAKKYLMNLIEFTMFINSVTDSTPIVVPKNPLIFEVCGSYLLFLNQLSEESINDQSKYNLVQLVNFFDKLGNAMVL